MFAIAESAVVMGLLVLAIRHDDTLVLPLLVIFLAAIAHFVVRSRLTARKRPESSA
jgi:hypothetical protein